MDHHPAGASNTEGLAHGGNPRHLACNVLRLHPVLLADSRGDPRRLDRASAWPDLADRL